MSSNFFIVPGVYPQELDLTNSAIPISTTVGAAVFGSRQGTLDTYFETDTNDFTTRYGKSDYTWTFAHAMIRAFLFQGQGIWLQRVVNGAKYAGSLVQNDVQGVQATTTTFSGFPSGRTDNYTVGGQEAQTIVFAGPLITGNSVAVSLTSDTPVSATVTQAFSTDSNTTLKLLAQQIDALLHTNTWIISGKVPGDAVVIPVGSASNDQRVLRITAPEGTALTVNSITITGGTSQTTAVVHTHNWLFEVWAENPGIWANRIGYSIRNVDNGVNQRLGITFGSAITSGGSFNAIISVNGAVLPFTPVVYSTDMATTAQNIVNQILSTLGEGSDGWVVSGSSGLSLVIVSPVDGMGSDGTGTLKITSAAVTGGGNPSVTVSNLLDGIDTDETFEIWIYSRDNVNLPLEKRVVSFVEGSVDGNGQPLFIEDVINKGSRKSNYIRIRYNHLNTAGQILGVDAELGTPIQYLTGGDDGALPNNSQIASTWQSVFGSRRNKPLSIMVNCGYSSPVVQQMMDSLCRKRYDCFAILDMPSDSQLTTDAVDYRNNVVNINSSYSAIYTPDVLITDLTTGKQLFIPPSGHVAGQFCYNDYVGAPWTNPAGLNRGLIPNIQGLSQTYDDDQMALLIGAQINPIVQEPGRGWQIKSANTLQNKQSALSNINVRRLLIVVEITLVEALDYSIHEPNTPYTQFLITQICTNFLQPIKSSNPPGLYDFAVVCDSRTTSSIDIDTGLCNVDVFLKPVLPIKFIQLTSVITKTGAFFQETLQQLTGGISTGTNSI